MRGVIELDDRLKKGAAGPGGRPAAREPGLGTGRGGDVTGSRSSLSMPALQRDGRGGGRRARIAERRPSVRIGLRLALHEAVAGLRPEQDLLVLVVEDELALVGLHREHGVAVAVRSRTTVISSASRGQPASISMRRLSST